LNVIYNVVKLQNRNHVYLEYWYITPSSFCFALYYDNLYMNHVISVCYIHTINKHVVNVTVDICQIVHVFVMQLKTLYVYVS